MTGPVSELRRVLSALAASGLIVGAITSCTPAEANPDPGGDSTAPPPLTELTITMSEVEERGAETSTFRLTCDPVGGDLPTATAACANLAAVSDPFAPVKTGVTCLQMIEGPGIITVRGTWHSEPVRAQFSQVDSCESDRFRQVVNVLGVS